MAAERPFAALLALLRRLRDDTGDPFLLAQVRVGFGALLLNEAWLATQQLRGAGFFGHVFHQPFLPESFVPSEGVYEGIVAAQWAAGAAVVLGTAARPALLVGAALLVYTMLCDRLWFHHYRHTMAAFAALLAFSPCDRSLVLGRADRAGPAPLWAAHAMKAQVSLMYLASGGSKLLDPDWRGGLMMRSMVANFARLLQMRGVPIPLVQAMQTPAGASLLAKGAIATELSLAFALWWPPTRRLALYVGLFFHLSISLLTPVRLFTAEMLLVYVLFATPDVGARVLRFDPKRHRVQHLVDALDWLRRFTLEPKKGAKLAVIDRGGVELRGLAAAACVVEANPVLFVAWPAVKLLAVGSAALQRGRRRAGPSEVTEDSQRDAQEEDGRGV